MKKLSALVVLSLLLMPLFSSPAMAQSHDDHWHGDIHQFHDHDYDHWRGGNWFHGPHDGRDGWWWIVDGGWYFYPAPVYPYPDPYTPPVIAVAPAPASAVAAYWYSCNNPRGYYPYVPQCFGHWHRVLATTSAPPTVVVQQAPGTVVVQQAATPQPYPVAPQPISPQPMSPSGAPSLSGPSGVNAGSREQDDQQLNAFAAELSQIDLYNANAAAHLKDLGKRVAAFRQSLFQRNYNAMSMLKDTEGLQKQITAARANLKKLNASPVPQPVPQSPPSQVAPAPPTGFPPPPPPQ